MAETVFFAKVEWDSEAEVWYISETNFPGLVAESETEEGLVRKVHELVPELYRLNAHLIDWQPDGDLPICVMSERLERIRIAG